MKFDQEALDFTWMIPQLMERNLEFQNLGTS
jgi:hypothetical protein